MGPPPSRARPRRRSGTARGPPAALAQVLEEFDGAQAHPRPQAPRRPRKRLPQIAVKTLQQEHLRRAAPRSSHVQPGREDACVVDHDEGSRHEELRESAKALMPYFTARSVEHEQPRVFPSLEGRLRDQLGRQLVIKLGRLHADIRDED